MKCIKVKLQVQNFIKLLIKRLIKKKQLLCFLNLDEHLNNSILFSHIYNNVTKKNMKYSFIYFVPFKKKKYLNENNFECWAEQKSFSIWLHKIYFHCPNKQ